MEWNLEMVVDPAPNEMAHWVYKEMQNNNKQTKYRLLWLLLPVIAKMKVIENAGADLDAGSGLDFSQFELQLIALKPTPNGKDYSRTTDSSVMTS